MGRLTVLSGLALWVGASLVLAQVRPIGRPRLIERLRPFSADASTAAGTDGLGTRRVIAPLADRVGRRLAALVGSTDDASLRLERIHSKLSISGFRMRQMGWALASVVGVVILGAGMRVPTGLVLVGMPLGALGAYAVTEWSLSRSCRRFEERRILELPVIAEQLAMLVAAGHSLGSAVARISSRGQGVIAMDLARVHQRVRQGVPEAEALREWATRARSPSVERLVSVLVLSPETGDLGRLLTQEARAIRRSVQRRTVELMDRRSQQVWVPVTVAALVPGVIFIAVPFVAALRLFAAG